MKSTRMLDWRLPDTTSCRWWGIIFIACSPGVGTLSWCGVILSPAKLCWETFVDGFLGQTYKPTPEDNIGFHCISDGLISVLAVVQCNVLWGKRHLRCVCSTFLEIIFILTQWWPASMEISVCHADGVCHVTGATVLVSIYTWCWSFFLMAEQKELFIEAHKVLEVFHC